MRNKKIKICHKKRESNNKKKNGKVCKGEGGVISILMDKLTKDLERQMVTWNDTKYIIF